MARKEKLIDKAQKLVQKGYYDKAVAEYRAASDSDPRDISIRLRIGDLYVKMGRKEEAVKEYTEVAKANAQRGFYLKAIAVYKQVLKLEDALEVHNKLAELYTKQRLIADAISEYSYIVSYFERRGKSAEVLDLLKKMAEVDPDNIGVRLKLAEVYQRMSFDKDAMAEYSVVFGRLVSQGKLDKAEKLYQGLHNGNPADEQVMSGLVEVCRLKGDTAQQSKFLKALLKSYNASARTEDARKTALAINEISPNDPDAAVFLKKSEEDGWAVQRAEAALTRAGASGEAPSDGAELISWPEEEITVLAEGPDEARLQETQGPQAPSGPDIEREPDTEEVGSAEEPSFEEEADSTPVADTPPPAASWAETGPGEVEIDIEDLLKGDVPPVAGTEAASPAEPAEGPTGGSAQEDVPETGIPSEIEIEIEAGAPSPDDVETSEDAPGPVEVETGLVEEGIELEVMPGAGIGGATDDEPAADERPLVAQEAEIIAEQDIALEPDTDEPQIATTGSPEAPDEAVTEVSGEGLGALEAPPPVLEDEEYEPASAEAEPGPQDEAPEPDGISAGPDEGGPVPEDGAIEDAVPSRPQEPSWAGGLEAEQQEDISSAISELMEKIEPEAAQGAPTTKREDYVDLSAELGMEEALTDLAGSWGSEERNETFDEFRSGIGNQLSKEDSETHYNLGIAYMEMELFSEASKEFKIALKDPRLEFDCYTRLGLCAMSLGEPQEAVTYYLKGIKIEGRSIEERIGMMYELGLAYEAAGELEEAEELFNGIHELAPSFREVADKVKTSMQARSSPPPFMPLEDGLLEVELL